MDAVFYGTLAGLSTVAGVLLVMRWHGWATTHSQYVNSLAAGLILGLAFLSLVPEAQELTNPRTSFLYVLAGFAVLYVVETLVVFHSGAERHFHGDDEHHHHDTAKAWTVFSGLFLHSFVDGLVIGIGFEVSHAIGLLAAAGVILHELPEGVTTFALLLTRIQRRTAFLLSLAVAAATPAGALFALAPLRGMGQDTVGALLAAAAGSFIYVGAADLIPETHARKGWINAVFFVGGIGLAYGLSRTVH
jgi:zinc transporter ZupT